MGLVDIVSSEDSIGSSRNRLSTSQDTASKAHGLTGLRPSYSLRWFNFAKHFSEKEGDSVFNTMTSATIFNPNNCAHEQLFKASGRVEANIATTVTKDNICASGKEGIKGNDQTDNRTSLCNQKIYSWCWLILRTN